MPLPSFKQPTCSIRYQGYYARVKTPFNQKFIDWVKQFPGRQWDRSSKEWLVPCEVVPSILDAVVDCFGEGATIQGTGEQGIGIGIPLNPKMYEFQSNAVRDILAQNATGFLNFEMGLGKTPSAIEVLRLMDAKRILIVCPAVVRLNWESELQKWWPDCPLTLLADTSKKAKAFLANESEGCFITSYNLVQNFKAERFDAIILDESHYVKNNKAARSKHTMGLRRKNPQAAMMCLSATPITSEPKDLWHQLELLWPGRFGTFWQFVNRYSNVQGNKYGTEIVGVNDLHSKELELRVSQSRSLEVVL